MATAQDNLARKQIFIPASQPEAVVLRVAAYCRVSADSEDQLNSFAAQQSYYNDYIRKHDNWQLAEIYADEGITGTSAKKRKDFQRLLEKRCGLPVILWDERLTTVAADQSMMEMGIRRENRKEYVDEIAAIFILQGYLDYLSNHPEEKA